MSELPQPLPKEGYKEQLSAFRELANQNASDALKTHDRRNLGARARMTFALSVGIYLSAGGLAVFAKLGNADWAVNGAAALYVLGIVPVTAYCLHSWRLFKHARSKRRAGD
jgi:hypothetical protein